MKLKVLLIVTFIIIVSAVFTFKRIQSNTPPVNEMREAGKMLAEAKLEKCPDFDKKAYKDAILYYDSAMIEWKKQNERFFLSRNYEKVIHLSKKSKELSQISIYKSKALNAVLEAKLEMRLETIKRKIADFEQKFGQFPIHQAHRNEITKCKMLYSEGAGAYKTQYYDICKDKLDASEKLLNKITTIYQEKLITYFSAYPEWTMLVKHTIQYSKSNSTHVIVIDKLARKLTIYKNGKQLNQFNIELGANWVGDKQLQGDKSTPEGSYKILETKQKQQTKYYKALLLDYPNDEDKKRFALNKKNGTIRHDAKIGNLIEIHGSGGKGIDWTDGCVALDDKDMGVVFSLCSVGTKVTIVGSTVPFHLIASQLND